MAKIVKLKNKKTGEYSYPVTVTKAVADAESGERLNDVLAQKVEEAPMDGKQYARINGAWGEVEAGAISEIALISLLPNNDDLIGATVKVTTSDGEEILNTTWQGAQLSANVLNGAEYTVSVGNVDGYVTPEAQTYTAIKGVTRTVTMTYTESCVQVNILSNQENDTEIAAVKATVKYGSTSVEAGNGEYVNLPLNVDVTITFPEVTGYKTPDAISYSHTSGGYAKSGTYQTEIVTVALSADDDSSVSGQTVTINGVTQTYGSSAVSQKVPFGTTYEVSVSAKDGYTSPESQSFTASQSGRNLALVYTMIVYGVYIQGKSGRLYTKNEWDDQETVNGVALISENCSFVVSTAFISTGAAICDATATEPGYEGTGGSYSNAKSDYDGYNHTTKLRSAYGTSNSNYAANLCYNYKFPNGQRGYLPAIGEMYAAYMNGVGNMDVDWESINIEGNIWTSTYAYVASFVDGTTEATFHYFDASHNFPSTRASNKYYVRPFGKLVGHYR